MLLEPAVVAFPLRGEWRALNSPADRVPSHGTDFFAQRYAIDFFQVDRQSTSAHTVAPWRHFFATVPADSFHCWNAPVLAAEGGVVHSIGEGYADRLGINALRELARVVFAAPRATAADFRPLSGNYLILECSAGYLLYAHLRMGSVIVGPGDRVRVGQEIARVGNSGNTTMPHLHFQRMSSPDPFAADGLPILFSGLEIESDSGWIESEPMVPGRDDHFRTELPLSA